MDRNSIIGLALIMIIMVGYFFLTQDNIDELEVKKRQDSIANVQETAVDTGTKTVQATPSTLDTLKADSSDSISVDKPQGLLGQFAEGDEELVTIENELIKVKLSTKGGHPYSVELKEFQRAKREGEDKHDPLLLFEGNEADFNISFILKDGTTDSTARLFFAPSSNKVTVSGDSGVLKLKLAIDENTYLEQVYWLKPNSYELFYTLNMKGMDKVLSPNHRLLQVDWRVTMPLQESSLKSAKENSAVHYASLTGDVDNISATSYDKEEVAGGTRWISFKQKFFNSTWTCLNNEGFTGVSVETIENESPVYVKTAKASSIISTAFLEEESIPMKFYFGPNNYQVLKKLDNNMDELVNMGWGIFGWINKGMISPLFKYLNKLTGNFGIIILIMTIIIKVLLFGLVYKSYLSSAKMRLLKPEIDALKEKHGENLQKFQQEQMALFKKAGVSPLGGCLPLLIQMPFLIAMFQFFPSAIELRQQSFLWAEDLSTYDSIWTFGYVPLLDIVYGDHVSLFTLLMTVSTLIYTLLNNQLTGATGQMKYIGYIMPIFFLGFFNNYASGLTYYYFLTNVISIGQQFIMRRFVDEDALHRKIQENKKKPVKKSAFQKRLEDMAKKRGVDPKKMKR